MSQRSALVRSIETKRDAARHTRAFAEVGSTTPTRGGLAVVLHLYYPEMLPVFVRALEVIPREYGLFITLPVAHRRLADTIAATCPSAKIVLVPNRGRDVLPFVTVARALRAAGYESVLKLHTKKSPHRTDGEEWLRILLLSLLPPEPAVMSRVLDLLQHERTGVIGPRGQYLALSVNFEANAANMTTLLDRIYPPRTVSLNVHQRTDTYGFFAGTMFWARLDALAPLLEVCPPESFESERGRIDGTQAHAVERLVSLVSEIDQKALYEMDATGIHPVEYGSGSVPDWSTTFVGRRPCRWSRRPQNRGPSPPLAGDQRATQSLTQPPGQEPSRGDGVSVLIITHQLTRTGAPLIMLAYARWLVSQGHAVQVVALRRGEMEREFAEVAPTLFLPWWVNGWRRLPPGALRALVQGFWFQVWIRRAFANTDVVHANTVTCGDVVPHFARAGKPVVSHVHELRFWIENRVPPEQLQRQLDTSTAFVCVSESSRNYLSDAWHINRAKIVVVPELVVIQEADVDSRPAARKRLGVAAGTFLAGACGTLDWRKGSDLFVQVAFDVVLRRGHSQISFVWLGGESGSLELAQLRFDVELMGLANYVQFIPAMADPVGSGWYAALDAFVLTSREDPYPLVMQEAASAKLPVLGFRRSGGVEDFVLPGETGELVEFGDCQAMGGVLSEWAAQPELTARLGASAYLRWKQNFEVSTLASRLLDVDLAAARATRHPPSTRA